MTFEVLNHLNELQLNNLIKEKQEFLIGCARTLAHLHAQIEIAGGKEYAPQSMTGQADLWQQLFEEARVVLNNALIINKSRGNGVPLLKALKIADGTFTDLKPVSHLDAQAMVARCVSCAGGVDSVIGKPQREIADIFECQHCGVLQDFGGTEVTQQMAAIISDDVRSQIDRIYRNLVYYQNIIVGMYGGNIQAFYKDERAHAIAGPQFDQAARYPRIVADANRIFASINKYKGRIELPIRLDPQFSTPSEIPPQAKRIVERNGWYYEEEDETQKVESQIRPLLARLKGHLNKLKGGH